MWELMLQIIRNNSTIFFPQIIPQFFYFTRKEILKFLNLPLKNSIGPRLGGGVQLLTKIAQ